MPPTRISGVEIKDGSIQRKDLDTTTTGQSVLTSLAISGDFSIVHTGADIGTGDVTISLQPTGVTPGRYTVYDVDENGRITGGDTLQASDLPSGAGSYIQNQSVAAQTASLWINGFLGGADFRAYNGAGTQYVSIAAPAGLSGSYTFKLPPGYGVSGQLLTGDGLGGLSWSNAVTSVGLSAAALFTVTGSPVTGSGVLAFSWSGSSADIVRADGSVVAQNTLGDMRKSVYDTTNTGIVDGAESTVRVVYAQEAITKGDPLYISSTGNPPMVMRARQDNAGKMPAVGIAKTDIASGTTGLMATSGSVPNMDTGSWPVNTVLFVAATGGLTSTKPASRIQPVAIVLRAGGGDGVIEASINLNVASVTSVGLAAPSTFTVTNSPVTEAGTLTFSWAGASTDLVNADGSLRAVSTLEPTLPTGTTAQYFRGNKTLATFPTALPPSGAASGDLSGTYPGPSVVGLRGVALPALGSTALLRYDGSVWVWDSSSYLTANQSITLSGDVAGTGTTAITAMIQAGAVTLTKMAALAANSILGNNTGSAATPLALTPAQVKSLLAIAAADVSGLAAIAASGSASDLSTGTVPVGRLPLATTSVYGAVQIGTGINVTTGTISIAYGTGAGTAAQGNDARLSDARTPTAHVLDSGSHIISGKTGGQILLATSPNTFAFTTITGDATVSGAGALTLVNASVTGQVLTGYALGSGSAITAADTILVSIGKAQAQINDRQGLNANLTSISSLSTSTTGLIKLTNGVASLDSAAYLIANQTITLSGGATGSGTTAITVTLSNTAVTGQVLTGFVTGLDTEIVATDSILTAFNKTQGQIWTRASIDYVDASVKFRTPGVANVAPPGLTPGGDGSFTVGATNVVLNSATDFSGSTAVYSVSGGTFTPPDNTERYLCAKYNAGSPIYYLESSLANVNGSDTVGVYAIWRVGTEIHSLSFDSRGLGLAPKIANMITNTRFYSIARGNFLTLDETSTPVARTVTVAAASVYAGTDLVSVAAFNSSTGGHRLTLVYHVGGVWTYRNDTQYDNTHYDNGTDLVTLASNRSGVLWFYRTIGDDTQVLYVMGKTAYNNAAAAESEPEPTGLPIVVQDHAILIGRIIVTGGASSGSVSQVTNTSFTNSVVSDHNALNNVQGGAASEYYHFTSAEHIELSAVSTLTGAGLMKRLASGSYAIDTSTYLTANQSITLSGDATGSGTTAITVAISAATVTSKALTGYAVGANTALVASDTILAAFGKLQGQINNRQALNATLTSLSGLSTVTTGLVKLTNGVASLDSSAYLTANQSITMSGDVSGTGNTAITTMIGAGAVTLAKMADLAANSIIGNNTASAATPIALSVAQTQLLLGVDGGPFLPLTAGATKVLTGSVYSGGTFTYITAAPLNLVNSAAGAIKTQLNLVNAGGGAGAGSAIDFFTYDVSGGTDPGLRILGLDNNYSADMVVYTKTPNAAANPLVEHFRVAAGGTVTISAGKTVLAAGVAGYASLNIPHGVAPTTPVNGDIWTDTTGLRVRINGVTETMPDVAGVNTWTGAQTFSGGIVGVAAASNAATGHVGEIITGALGSGSGVTCVTNTAVNVITLNLTAGDWDVEGNVNFVSNATNRTITSMTISVNTTSGSVPADGTECYGSVYAANTASRTYGVTHPRKRISVAASTNVYLVARMVFSAGGTKAYGSMTARRVR